MEKKKPPPPEMPEYVTIKDLELDNSDETMAKSKKNHNALIYGPLGTQNITILDMLVL